MSVAVPVVESVVFVLVVFVVEGVVRAPLARLEPAAPVLLVLLLLERIVSIPVVVEAVVVVEFLHFLDAAAVHLVQALVRALALLAPLLIHLSIQIAVSPRPCVHGRSVPAVRQRLHVAQRLV